jgi:ATP-dependent RNA helicase DDX3X
MLLIAHSFFSGHSLRSFRNGWAEPRTTPSAPRGGGGWGDTSRGSHNADRAGNGFGAPRRGHDWTAGGGGGGGGANWASRVASGEGSWKDGKHVIGQSNPRLEKELFGDVKDPSTTHTGLNFEKYDDIPVEATGANVPEPVLSFTSPPLDSLLLENIKLARYTTPTPVQKYSIPVVLTSKSDLMGYANKSLLQ